MRRLMSKSRPAPAAKRKNSKPTRRRTRQRLDRRRAFQLGTGAAAVLVFALLGWLWHSGWIGQQIDRTVAAVYQLTAEAGFAVDDVVVEGRRRTPPATILAALEVERGTAILAFDPEQARDRLEALPWVGRAAVERRLPRIIYVQLSEREPLALWQLNGELSVIDRNGRAIPGAEIKRFAGLPLVVGEDAPNHAAALLALLDREPELRPRVTAAVRVGARRWNLRLAGGIDVQLPETNPAEAWSELARLASRHGLLERDVVTIDLRLPGRLVVRTAPGAQIGKDLSKAGHNT